MTQPITKLKDLAKTTHALADRIDKLKGQRPVHGRPTRVSMEGHNKLSTVERRISDLEAVIAEMEMRQDGVTHQAQKAFAEKQAREKALKDREARRAQQRGKSDEAETAGTEEAEASGS